MDDRTPTKTKRRSPASPSAEQRSAAKGSNLAIVVDWLLASSFEPLPEKTVPGTTSQQRRSLSALGALVSEFMRDHQGADAWPVGVQSWIAGDLTNAAGVPQAVRDTFSAALQRNDASEFLANIYEGCVANVNRRSLGTFFTPPAVVTEMLGGWQQMCGRPATVVDIGAGVGAFTIPAAERWSDSGVYGIDVNPVTLGLLGVLAKAQSVPLRSPADQGAGLRLVADDFIAWASDFESLPSPRLITGNPPYTRLQLLPHDDRRRLATALPGQVGTRANLSTWMLAQALDLLEPDDGVALLLPAHWLEADYAAQVRARLWGMARRRIEVRLLGAEIFPDARVDAVSLLVSQERDRRQHLVVWEHGESTRPDRRSVVPKTFRTHLREAPPSRSGRTISDVASARRGTASGANSFFLLSETQRRSLKIPRKFVTPLLRRLHGYGPIVSPTTLAALDDSQPRWILTASETDRQRSGELDLLLRTAEDDGVHLGVLCSRRDTWFDLHHDLVTPNVIIGSTTRHRFDLVDVEGTVAITNNLYGITWHDGVSATTARAVVRWLRSEGGQTSLFDASRHHAHGLHKIEPGALQQIRLPDSIQ